MKKCLLFNVGGKGKFARKAVIGKIQTKQNITVVLFLNNSSIRVY